MYSFEFAEDQDRAIAYDDNGNEIGECVIKRRDDYWEIDHTWVNEANRGTQVAGRMVEMVVLAAREAGVKLLPICSFAARALNGNPHYADILYNPGA